MRRKHVHESISEYESDEIEAIFGGIRGRLEAWVAENRHHFRRTLPDCPKELNARARDVWKPLLKIAENIDNLWRDKIFNAAIALSAREDNPDDISLQLRLLSDCREVMTEEFTPTKDLLMRLYSLEESPWGSMAAFNASLMATLLRNYGISSQRTSTIRGYRKSDFYDAWNRYIPQKAVMPVTSVTQGCTHDACDAHDGVSEDIQKAGQNYAQSNQ
jgi:Protein of unknown function (DUF3631)